MTTFPAFAPTAKNAEFLNIFAQLGNTYSTAFQSGAQEMWTSSLRIVQEHTARALAQASQDCVAALTKNAVEIGQRSFADLVGANQQAFTLMGTAFTNAIVAGATQQNPLRLLTPA